MCRKTVFCFTIGLLLSASSFSLGVQPSTIATIDTKTARAYFDEARAMSRGERGLTWGVDLEGPMLFVNPGTREIVANQADLEGHLVESGGVYRGSLPENANCANTAIEWAGVHWTMILWPLPHDTASRRRLMAHELFHRIQDQLGFPMANPANNHLDSPDGRIWLQLEWRALTRALQSAGDQRREAIEDALTFRRKRRDLFPDAASQEASLELNEGLAEYTGIRLSMVSQSAREQAVAEKLAAAPRRASFVRSFAYESGPAYGVLLDAVKPDWREELKKKPDLGRILASALEFDGDAPQRDPQKRAEAYGASTLRTVEMKREADRQVKLRRYRADLVNGPVIVLPASDNLNYSFNPSNLVPLEGYGTIYPTAEVVDSWGILKVHSAALAIRREGKIVEFRVPARFTRTKGVLDGAGFNLELAEGWTLEPGDRPGDLIVSPIRH